jgi:hypothetical protein
MMEGRAVHLYRTLQTDGFGDPGLQEFFLSDAARLAWHC